MIVVFPLSMMSAGTCSVPASTGPWTGPATDRSPLSPAMPANSLCSLGRQLAAVRPAFSNFSIPAARAVGRRAATSARSDAGVVLAVALGTLAVALGTLAAAADACNGAVARMITPATARL